MTGVAGEARRIAATVTRTTGDPCQFAAVRRSAGASSAGSLAGEQCCYCYRVLGEPLTWDDMMDLSRGGEHGDWLLECGDCGAAYSHVACAEGPRSDATWCCQDCVDR